MSKPCNSTHASHVARHLDARLRPSVDGYSSEIIHSLLPLFRVVTLGASALAVGGIEGLAEAAALIAKVFSGALSDYLGMTQGLLATMVAETVPEDLRGTACGFFNLTCGVAKLLASVCAGWLWDVFGAAFTFYARGAFACQPALAGLAENADLSGSGLSGRKP